METDAVVNNQRIKKLFQKNTATRTLSVDSLLRLPCLP